MIHRIPQMLLMCTGSPDRCAGSALLWALAVIPGLSAGYGRKVAGNPPVRNAGHHAAVMEVYDGAVIAHISVFQKQAKFPVHIFMDSRAAVAVSPAFQISCHAAVTVHAVMVVVDIPDLLLDLCFLGMIICLPVFPVVVISIRADSQLLQQPADAVFLMVLVNEPISL